MTNNIGQMTEALGLPSDLTPASLALFSAAQGASRVVTGIASELALGKNLPWFCGCLSAPGGGVPRPVFLLLASLVGAAAHFILAVSTSEEGFAFGVTLSGVAFGMVWPMMVLITGEVFGTHHVGANYMFFDGFSSAVGTLLLSKFVAQEVYDEHLAESHGDPGASPGDEGNFKCFGTECVSILLCFFSLHTFSTFPFALFFHIHSFYHTTVSHVAYHRLSIVTDMHCIEPRANSFHPTYIQQGGGSWLIRNSL